MVLFVGYLQMQLRFQKLGDITTDIVSYLSLKDCATHRRQIICEGMRRISNEGSQFKDVHVIGSWLQLTATLRIINTNHTENQRDILVVQLTNRHTNDSTNCG
jgi:hypothetical protein